MNDLSESEMLDVSEKKRQSNFIVAPPLRWRTFYDLTHMDG